MRTIVLVATILVTIIIVLGSIFASPYVLPDSDDREYAEFYGAFPEKAEVSGQVDVAHEPEGGVVMIDLAHRNRVSADQLDVLESVISAAGYRVKYLQSPSRFDLELGEAASLVIIDPGQVYTDARADRVSKFVDNGGRVVLLGEPRRATVQGFSLVQVESEFGPLASKFNIQFSGSYLYNMQENEGNYRHVYVEGTAADAAEDVDRASVQTAAAVSSRDGTPVLQTTQGTQLGSGPQDQYTVAVQQGNVLAVGDSSFIAGGNHLINDNDAFTSNLVEFLVSGERNRTLIDYPAVADSNPTIQYTEPGLLPVAQSISSDSQVMFGGQPSLVLEEASSNPEEVDVLIATFDYLESYPGMSPGVSASGNRVSVEGYEGQANDLVIVHAPESGPELVIATDSPDLARSTADQLSRGNIADILISDSTAIDQPP